MVKRSRSRIASLPLCLAALLLATVATTLRAQPPRPKAVPTPLVETDGVHAGTSVRLALQVSLPSGVHVQADKPRDPSLIATALSFTPPAGVTIDEVVYPPTTDLPQSGQAQPLAVFEQNFVVGVRISIGPSIAPGNLSLPARLRYQACDASTCYIPAREDVEWTLRVVTSETPTPRSQVAEVFDKIRFNRR